MIDWTFIGAREGRRLTGYVPNPTGSRSGVTIGTGVDLSAQSAESLAGLPQDLIDLLSPYFGLAGRAALDALGAQPLTMTGDQVDQLDAHIQGAAVATLTARYDAVSQVPFAQLPDMAQTVIASVAFQYGNLEKRCPKFWSSAIVQDWQGCHDELMNFGDAYTQRRHEEAAYLEPLTV